ncbi:twitching motility protein PilT [Actimicrobium sp. GrIS 1.19]|uniref:type IV pilus twitching motility protein PilT n=1 Tax=Actimicrobium sp. GrIS 1.19 TaxID=3071708 RepID=UPI002DFA1C15|nr:twitching motility protein PilT [Actimicrobium sp. GrIS 1.19]
MIAPTVVFRDLLEEILELVSIGKVFTDIHIEENAPMMVKTPRKWQAIGSEPVQREEMIPLLSAIDLEWEERIAEGAIDRSFLLTQCRLRCNVYHCGSREKITISLRRLPLHPISIEKTGLPLYVRSMLEATRGIILVTGSTGSGKTTTIAAMLDYFNSSRSSHIITIEEPIEYQLQRKQSIISHKEVPTDTASFSSGLREAMRQNPDIIMVGEIRDFETADTLLHAGESGHLVLATMHTNSALTAISKLLSFFRPDQRDQLAATLASALVGVICQSLVPTENGEALALASEMIFNNNQQVAGLIADATKFHMLADFMKRKEDNMSRSLNDALAQLVIKKTVSPKDAMRAAYNRAELHDMISGVRN